MHMHRDIMKSQTSADLLPAPATRRSSSQAITTGLLLQTVVLHQFYNHQHIVLSTTVIATSNHHRSVAADSGSAPVLQSPAHRTVHNSDSYKQSPQVCCCRQWFCTSSTITSTSYCPQQWQLQTKMCCHLITKQPLRRSDTHHTVLPANTLYLPSPHKRSPDGATTCS